MLLATVLGVALLVAVGAVAVATRHAPPLDNDPTLPAKPPPVRWKPPPAATDIPNIDAATIVAILVALPVILHLYTLVQAFIGDPQSPLYALLRWLANF
jgi:hypothetical protein